MVKTKGTAKKPYAKPKLTIYGKVSELTAVVGQRKTLDGGSGSTNRTAI